MVAAVGYRWGHPGADLTDLQWQELVQSGQQAHHQARELLRRPLREWERGTWQETWRAWAEAVLALEPNDPEAHG